MKTTVVKGENAVTTQIKATCPQCGEVELTPRDLRLVVCSVPTMSYYAFDCVSCVTQVRKPADDRIIALLRSGGVAAERWTIPAEALEEKTGPVLAYDDLLDFVLNINNTDFLTEAMSIDEGSEELTDRQ